MLRDFSDYNASAYALIAANALPLLGVLFLGWDTLPIIALYWVENVIIGAINVLKMITCNPDPSQIDWAALKTQGLKFGVSSGGNGVNLKQAAQFANHGAKFFLIPFFIFHYGFFCLVHGFFVFGFFGRGLMVGGGLFSPIRMFGEVLRQQHLWWCVIALAASHLLSFFVNFIGRGEYQRTAAPILMAQPYSRIIVLHVAIIFGGFVSVLFGSNAGLLMILIIGKTILDLSLHLREHERNAPTTDSVRLRAQSLQPIMPDTITGVEEESPATASASER